MTSSDTRRKESRKERRGRKRNQEKPGEAQEGAAVSHGGGGVGRWLKEDVPDREEEEEKEEMAERRMSRIGRTLPHKGLSRDLWESGWLGTQKYR